MRWFLPGLARVGPAMLAATLALGCSSGPVESDPPIVTILAPTPGTQLVGERTTTVFALVEDESPIRRVELDVAGETQSEMRPDPNECEEGCEVSLGWDTRPFVDGEQVLTVRALDRHGNEAQREVDVTVLDSIFMERIRVTGMTGDGAFGPKFEVEVHLYDADDGEFLGCAGANQGLRDVDDPDVSHDVTAWFTLPPVDRLPFEAVRSRNLRFVVTEDDDDARCPSEQSALSTSRLANDDDLFGESEPMAGSEMASSPSLSFGNVTFLVVSTGRPF